MKITKYTHACLLIEKDNESLIVDPGVWSTDLVIPGTVIGVVITHKHPDHLCPERLAAICAKNPDALIYAHTEVTASIDGLPTQSVTSGETIPVGGFTLEFTGGEHALIHESIPRTANLGVMIDSQLYYPGDSFSSAPYPVALLALPASAPWMKLSEAMDFLATTKPTRAFPTHDAILSETGQTLIDTMLGPVAEMAGCVYTRIAVGDHTEL